MDTRTLAVDFAQQVRDSLTPEQCASAVERNKKPEYVESCATHDFCDANMLMLDAMEMQGEKFDPDNQRQIAGFNAAWNMARRAGFDVEKLTKTRNNHEVANAIAELCGGYGRMTAALGAKQFVVGDNELTIKLPARFAKDGIDLVTIGKTGAGCYDLTCSKSGKLGAKQISKDEGVAIANLLERFRDATGLELRKPRIFVKPKQGLQA